MNQEVIFFKGQKIGEINEEKSYYLSYRNHTHLFNIFNNGFGISEKVLDYLYSKNIKKIIINYENLFIYSIDIDSFIFKSKEYMDGIDKQLILEGQYWNKEIISDRQERLTL